MLFVLIVENDLMLALSLKNLVEMNVDRQVSGIAANLAEALESIDRKFPDVGLIDINLAGGGTGVEVASAIHKLGVPSLFTTADPLPFPVPEIALGCLCGPYNDFNIDNSLSIVEKIIAGDPVDIDIPIELEIY